MASPPKNVLPEASVPRGRSKRVRLLRVETSSSRKCSENRIWNRGTLVGPVGPMGPTGPTGPCPINFLPEASDGRGRKTRPQQHQTKVFCFCRFVCVDTFFTPHRSGNYLLNLFVLSMFALHLLGICCMRREPTWENILDHFDLSWIILKNRQIENVVL